MIYFTADIHFGHARIIDYCDRPFNNADEMDRVLIKNWNSVVGSKDVVYILGDLTLHREKHRQWLETKVRKLNGEKHLILGNHDVLKPFTYIDIGFTSVHTSLVIEDFILCHDPAAACVAKDRKWLCGHVHDLFKVQGHVTNVGVDVWDYKPVSIEELND